MMVRSPRERAARSALTRPSSSTSWQFTNVTSFLCMGRLSALTLADTTPFTHRTGEVQFNNFFIKLKKKKRDINVGISASEAYTIFTPVFSPAFVIFKMESYCCEV